MACQWRIMKNSHSANTLTDLVVLQKLWGFHYSFVLPKTVFIKSLMLCFTATMWLELDTSVVKKSWRRIRSVLFWVYVASVMLGRNMCSKQDPKSPKLHETPIAYRLYTHGGPFKSNLGHFWPSFLSQTERNAPACQTRRDAIVRCRWDLVARQSVKGITLKRKNIKE